VQGNKVREWEKYRRGKVKEMGKNLGRGWGREMVWESKGWELGNKELVLENRGKVSENMQKVLELENKQQEMVHNVLVQEYRVLVLESEEEEEEESKLVYEEGECTILA